MLKRDRNILIQAANHSRPSTSAGGALSSAGGNDTASEAVNKASTGLKAAAVCGVVIAGLDTVVRAKDAYDNPNVTTVSRLGVSSARGAAAIRNANKVFTKGVVSGTAKKICAVAGVAGVVIDVYGNIVDPELTTGGKTLASTVDIIAGGLCFLGPVGIGVGICVGIASTVWLKPALRTTPTTT